MKELTVKEMSKLGVEKRKSMPNYKKLQKLAGDKGRATQIKNRIKKCISYLEKHGYKIENNIIKLK